MQKRYLGFVGAIAIVVVAGLSGCSPVKSVANVTANSGADNSSGTSITSQVSTADFSAVVDYISDNSQQGLIGSALTENPSGSIGSAAVTVLDSLKFEADGSVSSLAVSRNVVFKGVTVNVQLKAFIKDALNNDRAVTSVNAFDGYDLVQQLNALKVLIVGNSQTSTVNASLELVTQTKTSFKTLSELSQLSNNAEFSTTAITGFTFLLSEKANQNSIQVKDGTTEVKLTTKKTSNSTFSTSAIDYSLNLPYTVNYNGHSYTYSISKKLSFSDISGVFKLGDQLAGTTTDLYRDGVKIGTLTLNKDLTVQGKDLAGNIY